VSPLFWDLADKTFLSCVTAMVVFIYRRHSVNFFKPCMYTTDQGVLPTVQVKSLFGMLADFNNFWHATSRIIIIVIWGIWVTVQNAILVIY